jgi:hypothetical protein
MIVYQRECDYGRVMDRVQSHSRDEQGDVKAW